MKKTTMSLKKKSKPQILSIKVLPAKRIDPILEELYAVKAEINKEAKYSVKEILKRAYPSAT